MDNGNRDDPSSGGGLPLNGIQRHHIQCLPIVLANFPKGPLPSRFPILNQIP